MKIDHAHAVSAALDLLAEVGLDELSTRKLAQQLGVQQPALYWHFRDKRALLDAMNAELIRRAHSRRSPLPDEGWIDFLRAHAISFRLCLLSVRDGARVHAGARAEAIDLPDAEAQLALATASGLSVREALTSLMTLARYVVGSVLEEQAEAVHPPRFDTVTPQTWPLLSQAAEAYVGNADRLFRDGLEMILAGMTNRWATT